MPWDVHAWPSAQVIETTYFGRVDADELVAAAREALGRGRSKGVALFLTDCSDVTDTPALIELLDLAKALSTEAQGIAMKEALVVPRANGPADAAGFWETACCNRGLTVRVCADRQSAVAWLLGNGRRSGEGLDSTAGGRPDHAADLRRALGVGRQVPDARP